MDVFKLAGDIWAAYSSGSMFRVATLLRDDGFWLLCIPLFLALVAAVVVLYRKVPFMERNFEKWTMIVIYLSIAGIIFVEVFRRFVLSQQASWSTTLPAFLFLTLTWVGCAYSIRRRTQLNFNEVRANLPRKIQFALLGLDMILWWAFSYIVFVTTLRRTVSSAANFQVMLGTDGIMQWWFYATVPAAWIILAARAWLNFMEDGERYRSGEELTGIVSVTKTE